MARLRPPYQYVLDSSALIDLKQQYPVDVFPGVWERFNEMCEQGLIVAPKEVYREIQKGEDGLIEWADDFEHIFLEPSEEEVQIIQEIFPHYKKSIVEKYSTRPWADPLIIACAKHYGLPILQHELYNPDKCTIPFIAKKVSLKCLRLPSFFSEEGWQFINPQ